MIARRSTFALALASTALLGWAAQADTRVGVAGAVNPSAAGTPPGSASRQLVVGSDIVFRERVITTTDGQAQILFLDQSSLLIGPNSTVVIDEFVYDPATSKGNIAATLTQGSFRYIGGKLSKQGNATLKTPVATIGIRGSDVTVNYQAASRLMNVIATHGIANIQTVNGALLGLRSGFGATIDGARPPAAPTALSAAQIAAANKSFEGQPGKSGGAGKPPTDGDVANSGLGSAVEAQGLAAIETAAGPVAAAPQLTVPFRPTPNDIIVAATKADTNESQQTPPPGTGVRSTQGMSGYVAGFGFASSGAAGFSDILTNDSPGDVTVQTRPDATGIGRVFAVFNFRSTDTQSIASAGIELGDPLSNPGLAVQSIFLDDVSFLAQQNAASGKAHINGDDASVSAVMVSIPALGLSGITGVPDDQICSCEFVTWGMWTANLSAAQRNLVVPVGLWVAGKLPDVSDPSPQGSAVFSGTALGMVQDGGAARFATGAFTNNYNFSQRSGLVSISNFDVTAANPSGHTFGGTVNAVGNDWRSYSGGVSGAGLTGTVNGAFYGNRNAAGQLQIPKETAGNFNVGKSGYAASGIFIGTR